MDDRIKYLKQQLIEENIKRVHKISGGNQLTIHPEINVNIEKQSPSYILREMVVDGLNLWLISKDSKTSTEIITNCKELPIEDVDFNVSQLLTQLELDN